MEKKHIEKFWSNVKIGKKDECWEWIAGHCLKYGVMSINGKTKKAHRISFEIHYGKIEKEMICHKCDNPPCVNPDHLFQGTRSDNMIDCYKKGRQPHLQKMRDKLYSIRHKI